MLGLGKLRNVNVGTRHVAVAAVQIQKAFLLSKLAESPAKHGELIVGKMLVDPTTLGFWVSSGDKTGDKIESYLRSPFVTTDTLNLPQSFFFLHLNFL